MKQPRLRDQHHKRGAVFGEVTGWEMPIHYGNPTGEHAAVRNAVGVADLSHRARIRVTGDDRVQWLQSVISNDILPLTPGSGLYSSLLTHKGKMLTYFRVYALTDSLLVEDVGEIGDITFHSLRKFLLYGTKAKMESLTESWGSLLVSGPKAASLIHAAFGLEVSALSSLGFVPQDIGGREALVIRTDETGEMDIEIMIPGDGLVATWERLWDIGTPMGLQAFGDQTREVLRIEAGLPRAGADLNEQIVPPEANLEGTAFSLTKGCYPGQEVVARMDTYGGVRRRLVGLAIQDSAIPSPGGKIFSGDREIGWVSSAVHSPSLGCPIAFGFPLRDFTAPGTPLTVQIDGQPHKAEVRALPFYTKT